MITVLKNNFIVFLITLLLFDLGFVSCDNGYEIFDLRENAAYDKIDTNTLNLGIKDSLQQLNYTNTLLSSWKLSRHYYFRNNGDMGEITQALSFVGDNETIIRMSKTASELMRNSFIIDTATVFDPHKYILRYLSNNEIIMFNEAHDRVQTRAFILSMLEELRKAGAECLAMETLNEKGNLTELDGSSGYYTSEPISGQLFREAVRLGYKIIAYEDIAKSPHSPYQRDSIQAQNLYNRIKTNASIKKTIVIAGYGHIDKTSTDPSYKTMAMWFKEISHINPITVNQCNCVEENYMGIKLSLPDEETCVAINNSSLGQFLENFYYDITICHPSTKYIHGRPEWLITSNKKQFINIEIEINLKPVLIQTYLSSEVENGDFDFKVPFDQTFLLENNNAWFVLENNQNYIIVYRDQYNNIILRKKLST